MTRVIAVIPARMGSSRFPGKPLANLRGRPMIEHVYERTAACPLLDEVLVATCDTEIAQAATRFGARVVMTAATHERATDRVAEACERDPAEVVVMVQGDEPMILPEMVAAAVQPLLDDPTIQCVNLAGAIESEQELNNPNTIKAVVAHNGDALYFSRAPIPAHARHAFEPGRCCKQVCVIAFRHDALRMFSTLPPSPLEAAESIDMLRFLEHGIPVRMVPTVHQTHAVDTPEDLATVTALLGNRGPDSGA